MTDPRDLASLRFAEREYRDRCHDLESEIDDLREELAESLAMQLVLVQRLAEMEVRCEHHS